MILKYIDSFTVASDTQEVDYFLSDRLQKYDMQCFPQTSLYPFGIFPKRGLHRITFDNITLICGGNGSGKSTLLNIIAEKLHLRRRAPFNFTPYYEEYLGMCDAELTFGSTPPSESKIITSDDVFDYLLDIRSLNTGVDKRRTELFLEYEQKREHSGEYRLGSLEEYDELKRRNDARRMTRSSFVSRDLPRDLATHSNGESGYTYFTQEIDSGALYLLDEPENSLSATLQKKLADFIVDSARFYDCQFIISTHSPFLMAMRDAVVYDLDTTPVSQVPWYDTASVRLWNDFFLEHYDEMREARGAARES